MRELRFTGYPASVGFAQGAVCVLANAADVKPVGGPPGQQAARLNSAIATALRDLRDLMMTLAEQDAEILDLQCEILDDHVLLAPVLALIEEGQDAATAWAGVLDEEISGFDAADDDIFRARSADYRDIRTRVLQALSGRAEHDMVDVGGDVVFVHDLTPSRFLQMNLHRGQGVVLGQGSASSHVALLARARGVAMVVGVGDFPAGLCGHAIVDATSGEVVVSPAAAAMAAFDRRRNEAQHERQGRSSLLASRPAVTKDGTEISVLVNITKLSELAGISPDDCDGIGLVRTEFLFPGGHLPGEAEQCSVYGALVDWARGKPVTIRTFDFGGDKPMPGVQLSYESNPFLGRRGIRLALDHQDVLRGQLRALARAAHGGPVRILIPMVTHPAELATVRSMLQEECTALSSSGEPMTMPSLGIMVEVPAAAIAIDSFDADFFSIGSNDLIQYVTATSRDLPGLPPSGDAVHPAVMSLIGSLLQYGIASGKDISLCGDLACVPALVPRLLKLGLRALSVPPPALAETQAAIASTVLADGTTRGPAAPSRGDHEDG